MAEAESAKEAGVGDEVAPALADKGGVGEGGRLTREVEDDHLQEVITVQRGCWHL